MQQRVIAFCCGSKGFRQTGKRQARIRRAGAIGVRRRRKEVSEEKAREYLVGISEYDVEGRREGGPYERVSILKEEGIKKKTRREKEERTGVDWIWVGESAGFVTSLL